MPHTTNCKVSFDDNPERVYYGGQTVRGRIHLTLAKEKTIRGNCQIFQRLISIISLLFCMRWQYQLEFIVFFNNFFLVKFTIWFLLSHNKYFVYLFKTENQMQKYEYENEQQQPQQKSIVMSCSAFRLFSIVFNIHLVWTWLPWQSMFENNRWNPKRWNPLKYAKLFAMLMLKTCLVIHWIFIMIDFSGFYLIFIAMILFLSTIYQ